MRTSGMRGVGRASFKFTTPHHTPLQQAIEFQIDAGSYTITGASVAEPEARVVLGAPGSYAMTGSAALLATARLFKLAAGSYTITGDAATFAIARVTQAPAGAYTMTGFDAALIVVPVATVDDRDHGGERGQSQGRMPPPERRHHAELELFRNREYARAVAAAVPPPMIAHRNLTTTQHPTSRPVTVPITGRHK